MKIGNKIHSLRIGRGYSVPTVAELLKISDSTYRRLETDKHLPDIELLEKIANLYNLNFLDLLPPEFVATLNLNKTPLNKKHASTKISKKLIAQYEARIIDLQEQITYWKIIAEGK